MLKLSGASRCTSYRHYCKPKTMRKTSQAVSTMDRDKGSSARNCLPVADRPVISHTSEVFVLEQGP